ncbi:adhesion G protein-coupled receptor E1 [Elysia marginata]|uniref:Adhesion G protein-coupled receptor E1 n=1 Tax=Elysia marginata TaxID=1093978 RepID=A0AAV4FDE3_9GAST|nr:adhesion G protein-coupled receptor E1 [Elysia marginata]
MLGYRACHRLDIQSEIPIPEDSLQQFIRQASFVVSLDVREHSSHVLEYCPNGLNASLYFEDLFTKYGTLEDLEDTINSTLETYVSMVNSVLQSVASSRVKTLFPCMAEAKPEGQCLSNPSYSIESSTVVAPIMFGARTDVYYINYTQTSTCAFISIDKENVIVGDGGEKVKFEPTGNELSKSLVSFTEASTSGAGNVRVCVSEYKKLPKTSSCQAKKNDFDTWTISGLVSIICTSISLVCLALTFAVYLALVPLRSGGGKNIMVLTVLLFVAQALYEFGIEQFENREFCRAVGIAVHYCWLAAVFSMNACTVERFLKLCFPLKTRSFFLSDRRPFMLATGYALVCPLLIVLLHIAVSLAVTGDLGYGSPSLCYINSLRARVVALGVPVGVLVLANVVLLAVTMCTLRRPPENSRDENGGKFPATSLQSTKSNRVGLLGCVRLSVVTGITWLLVFLYDAIPSEPLSYIITGLVGLQGLVFFLSMIVNKRVIQMLEKYARSSTVSHTSSSGSNSRRSKPYKKYSTKETASEKLSDSRPTANSRPVSK